MKRLRGVIQFITPIFVSLIILGCGSRNLSVGTNLPRNAAVGGSSYLENAPAIPIQYNSPYAYVDNERIRRFALSLDEYINRMVDYQLLNPSFYQTFSNPYSNRIMVLNFDLRSDSPVIINNPAPPTKPAPKPTPKPAPVAKEDCSTCCQKRCEAGAFCHGFAPCCNVFCSMKCMGGPIPPPIATAFNSCQP